MKYSPILAFGINLIQLGVITTLAVTIALVLAFRRRWLTEILQWCTYCVRTVLWTVRAVAFGYGGYLFPMLLINVLGINSWERLTAVLKFDLNQPWIVPWSKYSVLVGCVAAFHALGGGFAAVKILKVPFRGRKVIRDAKARKPPSWWQRFRFQLFLVRKAVVGIFTRLGFTNRSSARTVTATKPTPDGVCWGNRWLPPEVSVTHFAVVGSTNSGKTLTHRLLMQSVLARFGTDAGQRYGNRAVVFDPKQDMHSILHGMGLSVPVITLNPFDARSVVWDLSVDINSPAAARQFAEMFVPEEKGATQRFFADAARSLFAATMIALDEVAPGKWDLRDVLLALHSKSVLQRLLEKSTEAWGIARLYFEDPQSFPAVLGTVATKTSPYRVVAAAWHGNTNKFSIAQWLKTEGVVVLGHYPAARNSIEPINQAFMERLSQLMLQEPEATQPVTWLFLDELRALGAVPCLPHLLTQGRSKGVCVAVGFQAIEGLREIYGHNIPDEMMGQCANKTFLRTDSQVTAGWVEKHFGTYETIEPQYGESTSTSRGQGATTTDTISVSYNHINRNAVLASELMSLPVTSRENGMSAFHDIASVGAFFTQLSAEELDAMLMKPNPHVPNRVPITKEKQTLRPWDDDDARRLGLPLSDLPQAVKEQTAGKLFEIRREDT